MPIRRSRVVLALTACTLLGAGAAVLLGKPWIRDVQPLNPPAFADQMNRLIAARESDELRVLMELSSSLRDRFYELDSAAFGDTDDPEQFLNRGDDESLPSNAVVMVHEHPPRGAEVARQAINALDQNGSLDSIKRLLSEPLPPPPWKTDTGINDQFANRNYLATGALTLTKVLLARSRLAALDGRPGDALDDIAPVLALSDLIDRESLLMTTMVATANRQRCVDQVRLMTIERAFDLPSLQRADRMLAGLTCTDADWEAMARRLATGEGLFSHATLRDGLAEKDLDSKVNRRRIHDAMATLRERFIAQLTGRAESKDSSEEFAAYIEGVLADEPHGIEEMLNGARSGQQMVARSLLNQRAFVSGVRHLIAIERHRLEHGELPVNLDAIAGSSFQPPHPDRRTLVYEARSTDLGYILYLFGPDGLDNKGVGDAIPNGGKDKDVVLTSPRRIAHTE